VRQRTNAERSCDVDASKPELRIWSSILGVHAGTFRDVRVGCRGEVVLVLFTAGSFFGLVAMVIWKNGQGAGQGAP
jgi:hypothetical protein